MKQSIDPKLLVSIARSREQEITAFLQDLVQIPSVNGRETERAVAERVMLEAQRLQLDCQLAAADPTRPNVVTSWGHGSQGFILLGHMDTVSEGSTEAWSYPPFQAHLLNGRMFGRGSADNKAGIACALYTLALLRDHALLDPTRVRLVLACVVDEESGASSKLGVRYLLDHDLLQPARAAIYCYASDIICIGHRGLLRLLLHANGKAIHTGSLAWSKGEGGVNAVTGLAAVLVKLEALDITAPAHPAFIGMVCRITPGTLISGGEFESIVPAYARAMIDIRLMPGQSSEAVIEKVEETITSETELRPGLSISIEIKNNLPGVALPAGHFLPEIARKWTREVTGSEWPVAGAGPANEGYMLIQAGIPTLCGFGPTGGNAHAPDEWVDVNSLSTTVAMYAGIILDSLAA